METIVDLKRKEYNKHYYEKNKERILKGMNEKVYCKYCNREYAKHRYDKHCRSTKHIMNLKLHNLENNSERIDLEKKNI